MPDIQVSKKKLPKGTSYPLKTSMLLEAMKKEGIDLDVNLHYSAGVGGCLSFGATFYPPGGIYQNEHILIFVNNVPAIEAKAARAYMEEEILPSFIQWLKDILAHPLKSTLRQERQEFHKFGDNR
jgi:hypothetical protein